MKSLNNAFKLNGRKDRVETYTLWYFKKITHGMTYTKQTEWASTANV
jgi:hypothetical protein